MTSNEDCGQSVEDQITSVDSTNDLHDDNNSRPKKKRKTMHDSFELIERFNSFDLEDCETVDPLLGVSQKLFPIMGKVASLITKIRKEDSNKTTTQLHSQYKPKKRKRNSLMIISKAVQLKTELENWSPPSFRNLQIEDPLFDLASTIATAEAYRYATLLYLHQAVPEIPSSSSHSLAENILMLFASIPTSSRTCVTHIFPLLVASCEAEPGDEREWVKERWGFLSKKMWIGTIDRAFEVVKEVWSRRDILRNKKDQVNVDNSGSDRNSTSPRSDVSDEDAYYKVTKRINDAVNSDDVRSLDNEPDVRLGGWAHWTTVMDDWNWEVLLA
ncbi:unnamed protein product [Ambrosiozyma monospora]|uniref:Unnamed protein product n=1 Tax=Ambrosiozyma monospora TaxID=43982 RepID=A0A9W6Z7E4_AMBMO|nr:unnamed protein product [Ambrosiozyma monospora]